MPYTKEQIAAFKSALDKEISEGCALYPAWDKVSGFIERAATVAFDEDFHDMDSVLDAWTAMQQEKRMYLERVFYSEHSEGFPSTWAGLNGYRVRRENEAGQFDPAEYTVCKQIDGEYYIPVQFLESILRDAYIGYHLIESKEWERVTIEKTEGR